MLSQKLLGFGSNPVLSEEPSTRAFEERPVMTCVSCCVKVEHGSYDLVCVQTDLQTLLEYRNVYIILVPDLAEGFDRASIPVQANE